MPKVFPPHIFPNTANLINVLYVGFIFICIIVHFQSKAHVSILLQQAVSCKFDGNLKLCFHLGNYLCTQDLAFPSVLRRRCFGQQVSFSIQGSRRDNTRYLSGRMAPTEPKGSWVSTISDEETLRFTSSQRHGPCVIGLPAVYVLWPTLDKGTTAQI